MKNSKLEIENDLIFHTLHQNWEGAVSMGLQRLSDDELLGLLSEVGKHVDDSDNVLDEAFADVPDWDDKTPSELEVLACQFAIQVNGGTSSGAIPVRAPLRRRQNPSPAKLSFEELESRFSPSSISVIAHSRAGYAPVCTSRWALAEEQTSAVAFNAPTPAWISASAEHADHILFDFDAEDLNHMALAQVA